MKRLLLLRHAKAVPHGTVNDFDRTLADQGRRDMVLLARHLGALAPGPDLALVSPAARARATWEACGLPGVTVRFEETIYEASVATLLRLVGALPETSALPILVGHNPGFEDLAASLPGGRFSGLPTAGLVLAEWPSAERWREVAPDGGRIVETVTPASLGGHKG